MPVVVLSQRWYFQTWTKTSQRGHDADKTRTTALVLLNLRVHAGLLEIARAIPRLRRTSSLSGRSRLQPSFLESLATECSLARQ